MANGIPFKWQTNPKPYYPVGIPKVRMPKIHETKVKAPKMPKQPRIKILDRLFR